MKGVEITIKRRVENQREAALTYFRVINALYDLKLSKSFISLLAHCAIYGTISTPPAREAFIRENASSVRSVYNMVAKLQKKGLMVKEKGKIRVAPKLMQGFDKSNYLLKINLWM